jgi:type IV secretory pathway TrbF-like protein
MKEEGLGSVFIRHLVMAVPWGIISILVFLIAVVIVKGHVKDSIQYGVQTAIHESFNFVKDKGVTAAVKNNIKKGIAFTAREAKCEIKNALRSPELKQRVKNAMQYAVSEALKQTNDFVFEKERFARVKNKVKKAIDYSGNALKEAESQAGKH